MCLNLNGLRWRLQVLRVKRFTDVLEFFHIKLCIMDNELPKQCGFSGIILFSKWVRWLMLPWKMLEIGASFRLDWTHLNGTRAARMLLWTAYIVCMKFPIFGWSDQCNLLGDISDILFCVDHFFLQEWQNSSN